MNATTNVLINLYDSEQHDAEQIVLLADDDDERERLLGETLGGAIVDCGCTTTLCGKTRG